METVQQMTAWNPFETSDIDPGAGASGQLLPFTRELIAAVQLPEAAAFALRNIFLTASNGYPSAR